MMWTRKELKSKGKASFQANRWKCILVGLILALLTSGTIGMNMTITGMSDSNFGESVTSFQEEVTAPIEVEQVARPLVITLLLVLAALVVIGVIVEIAIFLPLEVGACRFCVMNLNQKAEIKELGYGFDHSYKNVVSVMLLYYVKIILWSLLLVIPGIVKAYEYRMVPYLLSEHPDMSSKEIFRKSKEMMTGQKGKAFVLDLSFIGWHLLGALTLGIVEVLYTEPYHEMTNAALYERLMYGENDV